MAAARGALRAVRRRARATTATVLARRPADPSAAMVVAGHGRGGTTWVAEVLRDALGAQLVFEPCNGGADPQAARAGFPEGPIVERGLTAAQVAHVRRAAAGGLASRWATSRDSVWAPLRRRGVVVKCIRVNAVLDDVIGALGCQPGLLVVRDPAAVVTSRMSAGWTARPERLLAPRVLDVCPQATAVVADLHTEVERHAAAWALDHAVVLRTAGPWRVVDHRWLADDPVEHFGAVLAHWSREAPDGLAAIVGRRSSTAGMGRSADAPGVVLDAAQVRSVRTVVGRLGALVHDEAGSLDGDRLASLGGAPLLAGT